MNIEDFPKNDEIKEIEKSIEELKATNSWEAIMLAKTDLQDLLQEREKWVENGGFS